MTCCIGYKTEKALYFISDTQGSTDDVKETRLDPKVFKVNNMLFATCGSFRMRDVLMYELDIPRLKANEDLDKYMRTTVINAIRDLFVEKGICIKTEESDLTSPGDILIGIKDKIYKIESDFQVGEINKAYVAIGCGSREAMAAMSMYEEYFDLPKTKKDINQFLIKTIKVVSNLNLNVNDIYELITQRIS